MVGGARQGVSPPRPHRREVSDIALGTGGINGQKRRGDRARAIERGVTYFDTAPDYSGAGSRAARMGRAMKGRSRQDVRRHQVLHADGHMPASSPVSSIHAAVEGSLKRLQTDHVDLVHIHSCDEVERLMDPNVHEAFDRLKEQGKVRFLGVSTHTPDLEAGRARGDRLGPLRRDDARLPPRHLGRASTRSSTRRAQKDIGIVAMKTLKGAKPPEPRRLPRPTPRRTRRPRSAGCSPIPTSACLVVSFCEAGARRRVPVRVGRNARHATTSRVLRALRRAHRRHLLPPALRRVPRLLPRASSPINDVLRYRMYFEDYGREKEGMRLYAALERNRPSAASAARRRARRTVPIEIPIRRRMLGADRLLG